VLQRSIVRDAALCAPHDLGSTLTEYHEVPLLWPVQSEDVKRVAAPSGAAQARSRCLAL